MGQRASFVVTCGGQRSRRLHPSGQVCAYSGIVARLFEPPITGRASISCYDRRMVRGIHNKRRQRFLCTRVETRAVSSFGHGLRCAERHTGMRSSLPYTESSATDVLGHRIIKSRPAWYTGQPRGARRAQGSNAPLYVIYLYRRGRMTKRLGMNFELVLSSCPYWLELTMLNLLLYEGDWSGKTHGPIVQCPPELFAKETRSVLVVHGVVPIRSLSLLRWRATLGTLRPGSVRPPQTRRQL